MGDSSFTRQPSSQARQKLLHRRAESSAGPWPWTCRPAGAAFTTFDIASHSSTTIEPSQRCAAPPDLAACSSSRTCAGTLDAIGVGDRARETILRAARMPGSLSVAWVTRSVVAGHLREHAEAGREHGRIVSQGVPAFRPVQVSSIAATTISGQIRSIDRAPSRVRDGFRPAYTSAVPSSDLLTRSAPPFVTVVVRVRAEYATFGRSPPPPSTAPSSIAEA